MLPHLLMIILLGTQTPRDGVSNDTIRTVDARTVVVTAEAPNPVVFTGVPSTSSRSVDDLMVNGSARLIRRAAMAGEAVIGGLRGGQVALNIDGMKVHSACVDNMDPSTAYIELENLRTLELTQGSSDLRYGSNLGGALTFRLRTPSIGDPATAAADVWYDLNGAARTAKVSTSGSTDAVAVRLAYTYRSADDYVSGGRVLVEGSRFEKHNALAAASWEVAGQQTVELTAIYDLATFIGYPALIMDTRRAEAMIAGLSWKATWSSHLASTTKLYANTIDHTMDDLSRPLEEIRTRPFMTGMWMPMHGRTITAGLLSEFRWAAETDVVSAILDLSMLSAVATMDMIPVDTSVTAMQMTNIGSAVVGTYGLNTTWDHVIGDGLSLRSTGRIDVSPRTLTDPSAREILQAYTPGTAIDQTLIAFSASVALHMSLAEYLEGTVSVSSLERLPTHREAYGFWLYDPQANIVTVGDPGLASERSWGVDLVLESHSRQFQYRVNARTQLIERYIAPGMVLQSDDIPVRRMANIGTAHVSNLDASGQLTIVDGFTFGATIVGTFGTLITNGEPLPFITPLTGMLRTIWTLQDLAIEACLRGSVAQNRISTTILPENRTAEWATVDLLAEWTPIDHASVSVSLRNVLDVRYHEHTSINDLAAAGRSFMLRLKTAW